MLTKHHADQIQLYCITFVTINKKQRPMDINQIIDNIGILPEASKNALKEIITEGLCVPTPRWQITKSLFGLDAKGIR